MKASIRFFAIALGLGLLMRLVLVLLAWSDPSILAHHDQLDYMIITEQIMTHGFGAGLGAERVPGYGLFLALCRVLAPGGVVVASGMGTHALLLALVLQNLAGLAAVYAIYRTGALVNQATANLAGGFAALNLNMAVYSNQILTDALFYPLFAWALYLFLRYRESGRRMDLGLLAVSLGLATMIRTVTMFFPFLIVLFLLLQRNGTGLLERGRRVAVFSVLFLALVAPWIARNYVIYGHASMATQGQAHIVGWVMPAIAQYEDGIALDAATHKYTSLWRERLESLPESVNADAFARDAEAKAWFMSYLCSVSPLSVAKAWFWGGVKNVFTPVSVELAYIFQMEWTHFYDVPGAGFPEQAWNFVVHNENRLYALMLVAGMALTLLFRAAQVLGALRLVRAKPGMAVAGLLVVGYFLAVNGPIGYAKYRLPLEPLFVLLTAMAAAMLPAVRREAREGGTEAPALRDLSGTALRLLLAGGCLLYAVWGINVRELGRAMGALALPGVVLAGAVMALDFVMVGLRLRMISGGRVGLVGGFNAGCIGVGMNNIFPAKLGEAAKAVYLGREGGVGLVQSLGWVFWERFSDLNMLVVLALCVVAVSGSGLFAWPVAALVLCMWGALALMARWPGVVALVGRLAYFSRLRRLVDDLAGHLRQGLQGGFLARLAVCSLLVWVTYFLQYVVLLRSAGGLDLDAGQMLAVFLMAAGGMALPSTPGGVGVYEAVMVAALSVYGVPREQALAIGVFYHVLLFVPTTTLALAVLLRSGLSLKALRAGAGDDGRQPAEVKSV